MEISPGLIIIILFILAPLLERLFKGAKQQQRPPEQGRPQGRVPPPRARPQAQPRRPQPEAEDASAADMLPDDLWEILTGQRRERPPIQAPREESPAATAAEPRREQPGSRRPVPQRPAPAGMRPRTVDQPSTPMRQRRLPDVDMRSEMPPDVEAQPWRRKTTTDEFPVEGYVREIPTHLPPEIVSLEELVIDDELRHARFHERVAASSAPAIVQSAGAHQLVRLLRQRNEVRRAIVMSEVLGPPKGLE